MAGQSCLDHSLLFSLIRLVKHQLPPILRESGNIYSPLVSFWGLVWYPYAMLQESPRLQKALAEAGVASRRACAEIITQGRVSVNGKLALEPGLHINTQKDIVLVDGEQILPSRSKKLVYILLNKPLGVVCTANDPQGRPTVLNLVEQVDTRVYPVGRLDVDSAGLLILTNDGDFAFRLTHPRFHLSRTYRVTVRGFLERSSAQQIQAGIQLSDGITAPAELTFVGYDSTERCTTLDITLYEGRNRQVRRMMDSVGHPVRALTRISFGKLTLGRLKPGSWRNLRKEEVEDLLAQAKPTPRPRQIKRT